MDDVAKRTRVLMEAFKSQAQAAKTARERLAELERAIDKYNDELIINLADQAIHNFNPSIFRFFIVPIAYTLATLGVKWKN